MFSASDNTQPSKASLVPSIEIKIIGNNTGKARIGNKELLLAAFVIIADKIVVEEEIAILPNKSDRVKIESDLIINPFKKINIKNAIIRLVNKDKKTLKSNLPK